MKSKKIVIVSIVVVIAVSVIVGFIFYNNSALVRINKQLDLGQNYLVDCNYGQAIVVFSEIIEVDPVNVEAYLGLAQAHIGLGDLESAAEVLRAGFGLVEDERLKQKLDEVTAELERIETERLAKETKEKEMEEQAGGKYKDVDIDILPKIIFLEKPIEEWTFEELKEYAESNCVDVVKYNYGNNYYAEYYLNDMEWYMSDHEKADAGTRIFDIYEGSSAKESSPHLGIWFADNEMHREYWFGIIGEDEYDVKKNVNISLWSSPVKLVTTVEELLTFFHPDLYKEFQVLNSEETIQVGVNGTDSIMKFEGEGLEGEFLAGVSLFTKKYEYTIFYDEEERCYSLIVVTID